MKILIVEDDATIGAGLVYALEQEGHETVLCSTALSAKEEIAEKTADLCLFDLTLPDGSGYDLCRLVKARMDVPVIFLTVCDEEVNVVMGLDLGADDYITKPFRIRELLSRINSVMRRYSKPIAQPGSELGGTGRSLPAAEAAGRFPKSAAGVAEMAEGAAAETVAEDKNVFRLGEAILVYTKEARVEKNGAEIFLTALEYRLLLFFLSHRHQVLTRSQILENLWDVAGDFVNDNTLTVYIKRLRDKLEDDPAKPKVIQTVRGLGYKVGV